MKLVSEKHSFYRVYAIENMIRGFRYRLGILYPMVDKSVIHFHRLKGLMARFGYAFSIGHDFHLRFLWFAFGRKT